MFKVQQIYSDFIVYKQKGDVDARRYLRLGQEVTFFDGFSLEICKIKLLEIKAANFTSKSETCVLRVTLPGHNPQEWDLAEGNALNLLIRPDYAI